MSRLTSLRHFLRAEAGAITVDWVVLTAAALGLTLVIMAAMNSSVASVGTSVEEVLTDVDVVALDAEG